MTNAFSLSFIMFHFFPLLFLPSLFIPFIAQQRKKHLNLTHIFVLQFCYQTSRNSAQFVLQICVQDCCFNRASEDKS